MEPVTPPLEIERKYLIAMPCREELLRRGAKAHRIKQTYLTAGAAGENRRVRKSECEGSVIYTYTAKRRISDLTCTEEEREISEEQYRELLCEARPDSMPVEKVRYKLPHDGHVMEIDVYPFWQDTAILEIELRGEDDGASPPPYLTVIREVTGDRRFKNTVLASWLALHPQTPPPTDP